MLKKFKILIECVKVLFDYMELIIEVVVLEVDLLNEEILLEEEVGDLFFEEEVY